jgi:ABC-type branched-subunit amino acid transport system substrate-binding protein
MLAILLTLGLVLAACGGSDGEDTTTTVGGGDGATTSEGGGEEPTTTAGDEPMDIAVDAGVDLEAGTITVGLLSDLTGVFGGLVSAIVAGMQVYWDDVNANGGIGGLTVQLDVRDTVYDQTLHVQYYEELKDQVVAFGHSTGSPQTMAIREDLEAQGILAIPLTWYSGWSDPLINSNLLSHGAPYCIEAMNMIEYIAGVADGNTLAIATLPGDYGLDSAEGAKLAAEALGLDVVYDGAGVITDAASIGAAADAIVGSDADMVWVTATPDAFEGVYGLAIGQGFEAIWSGAGPSWRPTFVAPDNALADSYARDMYVSAYYEGWFGESEGAAHVRDLMGQYNPDAPPLDYYGEGFVEASILHNALQLAYDNGDMTQAGVLAAAKSLDNVEFDGLAPAESYVGEPNDRVQRISYIRRPDPAGLAAGTSTGLVDLEVAFTSEIAAAYEFTGACYVLE